MRVVWCVKRIWLELCSLMDACGLPFSKLGIIRNYLLSNIYLKIMEHFVCPYCGSTFKTAELLSKHIDRVHLGSGLLEGDVRKY